MRRGSDIHARNSAVFWILLIAACVAAGLVTGSGAAGVGIGLAAAIAALAVVASREEQP